MEIFWRRNQQMMMKFRPKILVEANGDFLYRYKIIDQVDEFEEDHPCIITKSLNIDYYLLFGSIKAIITESGSSLSHLAITARENNIPVLLIENIISKIPPKGTIQLKNDLVVIESERN